MSVRVAAISKVAKLLFANADLPIFSTLPRVREEMEQFSNALSLISTAAGRFKVSRLMLLINAFSLNWLAIVGSPQYIGIVPAAHA